MGFDEPLDFFVLGLDSIVRLDARKYFAQSLLFVPLSQSRVDLSNKFLNASDLLGRHVKTKKYIS